MDKVQKHNSFKEKAVVTSLIYIIRCQTLFLKFTSAKHYSCSSKHCQSGDVFCGLTMTAHNLHSERCGVVVSNSTSYSKGPKFESLPVVF